MKFRAFVLLSLSVAASAVPMAGQTCSTTSTNKLICTLPQLFGADGLTLANPNHKAHFVKSQLSSFLPVNVSIGEELSTLPLGSSGSGTTFTPDSEGHLVPTQDSLGPILTERANVIGRKAFSLGIAYQYFSFDKLDGVNLHSFPIILDHINSQGVKETDFKNDYITTTNHAYLSLNQTVVYAVVGFTRHMDASIEVPIQQVHFRVSSEAHIVKTQPCEVTQDPITGGGTCTGPVLDPKGEAKCGLFHYFNGSDCATAFNSVNASFPSFLGVSPTTDATGIGDVTLRGKYEVISGEKLTGSVGIAVRLKTGDEKNFLGSGAVGLAPFGVLTYRAHRWSPHVRFGYQWNSSTALAGDPTGTAGIPITGSLPPELLYSGGADFRVNKRLSVAADLIGARVLSGSHVKLGSEPHFLDAKYTQGAVPTLQSQTESYSSDSIAVGGKVRLYHELVLIANITMKVDDGGLRANVVPLVGLSWSK